MSIRSVKFVPALLAGAVVGANLATMTDVRAQVLTTSAEAAIQAPQTAADGCLTTPKGATPAGSHWYYRLDRVTKRQCWYLREESDSADKFTRAAPPVSAPTPASTATADEPAQIQRTISRKAIADARAEWVSQQPRAEANPPARVERAAATAAPAPVVQDSPRIAMPNVLAPAPLSSMRWNDAAPTRASVNPTDIKLAAATPPAATPPAVTRPAAAQPPQAEEVQQPVVEQVAPFMADVATAKPTASLQKLLMVMAAALALAGLIVSAIVRIGRMRARRAMRRKRRAMWDSAKTAKTRRRAPQPQPQAKPQPVFQDEAAPPRRAAAAAAQPHPRMPQERITRAPRERPRSPQERPYAPPDRRHAPQDRMAQDRIAQDRTPQERAPQDREQQVAEMLSRLARSAQN
jgi:hypothetical protein